MASSSSPQDEAAGALISLNSQFQQQGTLDWVNLSKEAISFSFNVLSRLSAAGVDPYTLTVGQAIGNNFRLSAVGWRNVEAAIANLKAYPGFAEIIWYGFGLKTLPKLLATTEQGTVFLALCAALSECYHRDVAAEILFELV